MNKEKHHTRLNRIQFTKKKWAIEAQTEKLSDKKIIQCIRVEKR